MIKQNRKFQAGAAWLYLYHGGVTAINNEVAFLIAGAKVGLFSLRLYLSCYKLSIGTKAKGRCLYASIQVSIKCINKACLRL